METNPRTSKFEQSLCFRISSFIPFPSKSGAIFSHSGKRSQGSVISSDIRPLVSSKSRIESHHGKRTLSQGKSGGRSWKPLESGNSNKLHQEEEQFAFDVGGSFSLCEKGTEKRSYNSRTKKLDRL